MIYVEGSKPTNKTQDRLKENIDSRMNALFQTHDSYWTNN